GLRPHSQTITEALQVLTLYFRWRSETGPKAHVGAGRGFGPKMGRRTCQKLRLASSVARRTFRWRDYRRSAGRRPVKEFIEALSDEDAAEVAAAMAEVRE